jgi:hypothetical protein
MTREAAGIRDRLRWHFSAKGPADRPGLFIWMLFLSGC